MMLGYVGIPIAIVRKEWWLFFPLAAATARVFSKYVGWKGTVRTTLA